MLHTSTRKLIDRLSEMTELGKLDWTESDDGNIAYATEGYSVTLTETPNEVVITSKDGKELERATAEEIAATELEDGTSYTAIVAAMTKEASRVARGTEAAISTLLAGMDDSPAEPVADPISDTGEPLQEDLGDETAIITSDTVETLSEDTPADAEIEADAPEAELLAAATDQTVEAESEAAEPEIADPVIEGVEDVHTAAVKTDSTPDTEPSEATDDAEAVIETVAAPEPAVDEALTEDAIQSSEAQSTETVSAEEPDSISSGAEEIETEATTETEAMPDSGISLESDAAPEASDQADSESEVSEAVVRMAQEVNNREDNGLEIAAASAVGAVAAAAGLAATDDTEPEPSVDETSADVPETIAASDETAEPPAYIPFGLEASDEAIAEETTSDVPESVDAATEAEPDETVADTASETGPIETPTTFAAALSEDAVTEPEPEIETETVSDAAPEPEIEAVAEPTTEPEVEVAVETEPETEPAPESTPALASVDEPDPVEAPEAAAEPETPVWATATSDPAETASETPEPVVEPEPVLATNPEPEAEPISLETPAASLEPVTAADSPSESEPKEAYSLSGIGAGFGLGALAAKTEASGIPGPTSSSTQTTEKVVIDATEDVLPKLEGNLNASLAETASAAVSNAKLETANAGPAEEPAEAESDILKPRTRFNPWD